MSTAEPSRPASKKQIEFMQSLGLPIPEGCTLEHAKVALDQAQKIRYFAFAVARQEWKVDLKGVTLNKILHSALANPPLKDAIVSVMEWYDDETQNRSDQLNELHYDEEDWQQPTLAEFAPELPISNEFEWMRAQLLTFMESAAAANRQKQQALEREGIRIYGAAPQPKNFFRRILDSLTGES
jgi:hypothetical protein